VSDVDGAMKDRGKNLQVNVKEMSDERISEPPHQKRQTTLRQQTKILVIIKMMTEIGTLVMTILRIYISVREI
jgi:hypothetical protein